MTDAPIENTEPKASSKYALVIAVSKRAKQLREGSPKLVDIKSKNNITIALEEIAQGLTKIHTPTLEEIEASERRDMVIRDTGARHAAEALMTAEPDEVALEDAETRLDVETAVDLDLLLAVDVQPESDIVDEVEIESEEDMEDVEELDGIIPDDILPIETEEDNEEDDNAAAAKDE